MGEIVSVNFRGDELYGFKQDDGVFLALKPMVEAMGLDWSAQYRRVQRDPILVEGIAMMATPFGRGGDQQAVCIKVDLLQGWLFTIDSSRIKDDEVRKKVQLYQRECYAVLHAHFTGKARVGHDIGAEPDDQLSFSERLRLVTEARQSFDTYAAREMWFKQGLPVVPAMMRPEQPNLFSYTAIKHPDRDAAAA